MLSVLSEGRFISSLSIFVPGASDPSFSTSSAVNPGQDTQTSQGHQEAAPGGSVCGAVAKGATVGMGADPQ